LLLEPVQKSVIFALALAVSCRRNQAILLCALQNFADTLVQNTRL
jgi:hypothetical protein